jgi:hypothetical protein
MVTLPTSREAAPEEVALKANELLLWCSARNKGSWRQYRAAVEELHANDTEMVMEGNGGFPLHQQLRLNLERLAHVEFFAHGCKDGWRVAPPTLAAHVVTGGVRSLLCGARSPALRERTLHAAQQFECDVLKSLDAPDVFRFTCQNSTQLAELAAQIGISYQLNAPLAIISHVPPCRPPTRQQAPSEFPVGADWTVDQLDTDALCWHRVDRGKASLLRSAVLRFSIRFQRSRYYLRWNGDSFDLPRAVAIFVLLRRRRRRLISYDSSGQTLSLPGICRPPRLLERAIVLCSGLPPVFEAASSTLRYSDVPLDIARFAAELLGQSL